ncbi:hypothetical protein EDD17DRAFT_1815035 [Pisolithus thermaeus]|nr:hypothetical protein EDD17DRAFT_1815035 [Pisolithus thermaeus]
MECFEYDVPLSLHGCDVELYVSFKSATTPCPEVNDPSGQFISLNTANDTELRPEDFSSQLLSTIILRLETISTFFFLNGSPSTLRLVMATQDGRQIDINKFRGFGAELRKRLHNVTSRTSRDPHVTSRLIFDVITGPAYVCRLWLCTSKCATFSISNMKPTSSGWPSSFTGRDMTVQRRGRPLLRGKASLTNFRLSQSGYTDDLAMGHMGSTAKAQHDASGPDHFNN